MRCACLVLACSACAQTPKDVAEAARLNNLGVAYLNQQMGEKALAFFAKSAALDRTSAVPHLNAGIARLAMQDRGGARQELERATKLDPANSRGWYNLGLLDRAESNAAAMRSEFQTVVQLSPKSADGHYFLGLAYSDLAQYSEAVTQFQAALAIEPLHASAEFGLARASQRMGDAEGARQHLTRFQHITQQKLATTLAQTYGDQGALSLAEEIRSALATAGPMVPLSFAPIVLHAASDNGAVKGMCLLDRSGKGLPDLLVLGAGEAPVRLFTHGARGLTESTLVKVFPSLAGETVACAAGDFDNDGHEDLVLATRDRVLLWRNRGDGTFENVTEAAGMNRRTKPSSVLFVDFDHDGDLDVFVTSTESGSNVLWRNDGNGTFTEWTAPTGLAGIGASQAAALSDVDNDRAVDLLVAGSAGVTLFRNPREGAFLASDISGSVAKGAAFLTMLDFAKNGKMDVLVAQTAAPGVVLLRNVDGMHFASVDLPLPDALRAWSVAPVDFDNDGWIDIAALIETPRGTELRLLRNLGGERFEDVSAAVHLPQNAVSHARSLLATDADGDGDPDLLLSGADGSVTLLRNDGGNRNHSVLLTVRGLADNKSGIGTKVEVFASGVWQKWEINGQNGNSILAGLGTAIHPEIVRLLWPTGVPQDEIEPAVSAAPANKLNIAETDRRGSSCPIVFAWNGEHYEFLTDIIGAAVMGHWVGPNARNTPDPDEWIRVSGKSLQPDHGLLSLRIGEPMEEVNYLDQVRLVAVDHPAGTEVYPNERFKADPPFPARQTVLVRATHPVPLAWDGDGKDVTAALRDVDQTFVQGLNLLPYAGFTTMHSLTLDLGTWSPDRPLRLLMTGYIEYFTATSMYAAWQAGLNPVSPFVEAQLADGTWKRVVDDLGFPAGLHRTMVTADLAGALPPGTRRICISTNLQIYWDQVLVLNEAPAAAEELRETELPLARASLAHRGYPKQVERDSPGDLTYDYSKRSTTGPFIAETGLYTRYGEVTPLLQSVNDQFAVFGTGEDIDVEFRADTLPTLPQGWVRDYFFYANGYVKDMDFYEAMPFTVAAMPFSGMTGYPYGAKEHFPDSTDSVRYQLEWNDRVLNGDSHRSHALRYEPAPTAPEIP